MAERDYGAELDELKREMRNLIKELKGRNQRTTDVVSDRTDEYWKEAQDYYDKISGRAKEKWGELSGEAKDLAGRTDQYVKENPWKSVGMAAAAGFLAALLSSRGRR